MTVYTVFAWGFGSGAVAMLIGAVVWHRRRPAHPRPKPFVLREMSDAEVAQFTDELARVTRQCG